MKTITVIKECDKYKMEMLVIERTLNPINSMYQQMLVKEKDLNKRENTLRVFLEGRKFTQREIDFATDPNAVF